MIIGDFRFAVRERNEGVVRDGEDAAGGGDPLVQLDEDGPHGVPQDLRRGGKGIGRLAIRVELHKLSQTHNNAHFDLNCSLFRW